jgi:uncharacterized protein YlxW (UPF0749 family)
MSKLAQKRREPKSNRSESKSTLRASELRELEALQEEVDDLLEEIRTLEKAAKRANPRQLEDAKGPLDSVAEFMAGLQPFIGPLLALL